MQRIIDIEQILHFQFSSFAIIKSKEEKRAERYPLVVRSDDGKNCQRYDCQQEFLNLFGTEEDEDRCENTPDSVIYGIIGVWQKQGQDFCQKDNGKENKRKQKPCFEVVFLYGVIERINQKDRERKCNQDTLIKGSHCKEINCLAKKPESEYLQKVSQTIFCIVCTFRNHIGEDRKCQTTDPTEKLILRNDLIADMITGHGNQCKNFQLISGQSGKKFCFCFHDKISFLVFHNQNYKFSIKQKKGFCQSSGIKIKKFMCVGNRFRFPEDDFVPINNKKRLYLVRF